MEILKNIQLLEDVHLPIIKGPVGVSLSGGVDSSLLLYFLMKHIPDTIHIFTLANQYQKMYDTICSINVINKCIELTKNDNIYHHIVYKEKASLHQIFSYPEEFYKEQKITVLYTGITANPPKEVMSNFTKKLLDVDENARDPNAVRKIIVEDAFCMPWTNIDKKKICKIYRQYDLLEDLFPLTRSCTWKVDAKTSDPSFGHCGHCWWCQEREWGFSNEL